MHTKTWKLGEVCQGGIITVEITGKVIVVIGKEWDTSAGYTRKASQKNAKEFTRGSVVADEQNAYRKLHNFIDDLATHHWACEICDWIGTKVELKEKHFWEN